MTDSFQQLSYSFALQGGDFPLPPSTEKEKLDEYLSQLRLSSTLRTLFTGFDLALYRKQLANLHDKYPLPEVFNWDPGVKEAERLKVLSPQEKRIYYAFQQVLDKGSKSSKYLQAMQNLLSIYPQMQELGLQIAQYLRLWDPEAYECFVKTQLIQQPDWRILRYLYAGYLLLDLSISDDDAPAMRERFLEVMQGKLELHEHLQGLRPEAWEVLAFYRTQATWYLVGNFQPERALYAINVCFQVSQEVYPEKDLSEIDGFLQVWFVNVSANPERMARMQTFLKPLFKARLQSAKKHIGKRTHVT